MDRRKIIECVACGNSCGWYIPADREDPGYRYGPGEDWQAADGEWCCSRTCLHDYEEECAE